MLEDTANVEVLLSTQVTALKGQDGLDEVTLDRSLNGSHDLTLDGLFVEIGADPRAKLGLDVGVALNDQGEIVVDKLMRTNIEGVFAAGDLSDASGNLKQTITAAAQGALAATSAYDFVSAHPCRCQCHAMGYPLVAAV
jgi:thioredoxin reductase (NADPH)